MQKTIQAIAVLLLIGILGTLGWQFLRFRAARDSARLAYTRVVKKNDIVAAVQNSFAALRDAELRAQDYILTGETVYSEAYAADVRAWQDESGTLALITDKEKAALPAMEFVQAGGRTMDEIAATVAVFEKSGREAALERIRKSSGIVYLDQARNLVAEMLKDDSSDSAAYTMMVGAFHNYTLLCGGAGALAGFGFVASVLLLVNRRKSA